MMFRSRSCVIGRGVAMFSICRAMAFASKMPTQIGRTRSPSLSLRMTMGMLVIGSTISPLIVISISMAVARDAGSVPVIRRLPSVYDLTRKTMRARPRDEHRNRPANPRRPVVLCIGRSGRVHDYVPRRPPGNLAVAPPALRVDEHVHARPDRLLVEPRLDVPLQRLERHDARRLLVLADRVRHALARQGVRPLGILEREHAVV